MKKVYTKSEDVIKLFISAKASEARCRNVYFNDLHKIYSYGKHYVLGEFINGTAIMINDIGYSNTTKRHINQITKHSKHLTQFFKSESDINEVYKAIEYNFEKLKVARKPELYIDPILKIWKNFNIYIDFTGKLPLSDDVLPLYEQSKELVNIVINMNSGKSEKIVMQEDEEETTMAELKSLMML